jgi:hypothetical protein
MNGCSHYACTRMSVWFCEMVYIQHNKKKCFDTMYLHKAFHVHVQCLYNLGLLPL